MSLLKTSPDTITIDRTAKLEMSGGKVSTVRFKATYRRLSVRDARLASEDAVAGRSSDDDIIARDLVGWEMPGNDGNPVDFNEDAVAEAMSVREYRQALIDGWLEVQFGREGLGQKNGLRPGSTGRG